MNLEDYNITIDDIKTMSRQIYGSFPKKCEYRQKVLNFIGTDSIVELSKPFFVTSVMFAKNSVAMSGKIYVAASATSTGMDKLFSVGTDGDMIVDGGMLWKNIRAFGDSGGDIQVTITGYELDYQETYELFPNNPYVPAMDIVELYNDCTLHDKRFALTFNDSVRTYENKSGGKLYISERATLNDPIDYLIISDGSTFSFDEQKPYRFAIGTTSNIYYYKDGVESVYTGKCSVMAYGANNTSSSSTACKSIKQVYYNANFTTIGAFAFAFNHSIFVPPVFACNLKYIGQQCFRMMYSVKGKVLDFTNIYSIGQGAFNNFGNGGQEYGFDSVIFPTDHQCSIADGAFWLTNFKNTVYLPPTLSISPNNAFANHANVKEYIIDTNVPDWTFRQDGISSSIRKLHTIRFRTNCRSFGRNCFYYCTSIEFVYCEWKDNIPRNPLNAAYPTKIITLYIPKGQRENYKSKGWNGYNIIEI